MKKILVLLSISLLSGCFDEINKPKIIEKEEDLKEKYISTICTQKQDLEYFLFQDTRDILYSSFSVYEGNIFYYSDLDLLNKCPSEKLVIFNDYFNKYKIVYELKNDKIFISQDTASYSFDKKHLVTLSNVKERESKFISNRSYYEVGFSLSDSSKYEYVFNEKQKAVDFYQFLNENRD